MSPEEARESYIKLSKTGGHVGPFVAYGKADWSEVEKIYKDIKEANKAITQIGDCIFQVASPWHAYFFMQSLAYNRDRNTHTKFLYRGQSSPEKPLSTFYRKGVDPETANAAIGAFKMYAHYYGYTDEDQFSEHNLVLMARHHGLSTSHLDFTIDPAVALYFAGTGESVDGNSRIFFAPLSMLLRYAKLYYPPLFAQRLYVQRGVLLDIPEDDFPVFHSQFCELRFPREQLFVVYRKGKEVSLFPDNAIDDFFELLATLAMTETPPFEHIDIHMERLFKGIKSLEGLKKKKNIKKIIKSCFEDFLCMQVTLTVSRISLGDHGPDMSIDRELVKAIVRGNNYTYERLLSEAHESLKAARWYGGWIAKLQRKINNEILEEIREEFLPPKAAK